MPDTDHLWARLTALEDRMDANSENLRRDMRDGFSRLGSQFGGEYQKIVGRLGDHSDRLLVIEEQRRHSAERRLEIEKDRDRRAGLIGTITGAGAAVIFGILKSMFATLFSGVK